MATPSIVTPLESPSHVAHRCAGIATLAATPRALLLAAGATLVVFALWARRGTSWRAPLVLSASLWLATLVKLALQ